MRPRPVSLAVLAAGLAVSAALISGCSASESSARESSAPESAASASEAAPSDTGAAPTTEPSAAASADASMAPSAPAKPTVGDMSTDQFADAVLEQIRMDGADAPTDQLVTIAMSPLLRELTMSADMTTKLTSKGSSVSLTITGPDATCIVRVTDKPAARGVTCR